AARELGVLLVAVCALQLFARATFTGPPLPAGAADAWPFDPDAAAEDSTGGKDFLEALEADGEPMYELIHGVGYLWLAAALLGARRALGEFTVLALSRLLSISL
ncbi:unnamed protein product, partial [Prorocentrum cordatum]